MIICQRFVIKARLEMIDTRWQRYADNGIHLILDGGLVSRRSAAAEAADDVADFFKTGRVAKFMVGP